MEYPSYNFDEEIESGFLAVSVIILSVIIALVTYFLGIGILKGAILLLSLIYAPGWIVILSYEARDALCHCIGSLMNRIKNRDKRTSKKDKNDHTYDLSDIQGEIHGRR